MFSICAQNCILMAMLSYCVALRYIEIPKTEDQSAVPNKHRIDLHQTNKTKINATEIRRSWIVTPSPELRRQDAEHDGNSEKDTNLKLKIGALVQQTLHDTERRIQSIQQLKNRNRNKAPYKIGFILSMIKKTRSVLHELFNVAVKNRDQFKALEQMKVFELIVHTNVDTTNLVRQLVEIHVHNSNVKPDKINTTIAEQLSRRVVLIK